MLEINLLPDRQQRLQKQRKKLQRLFLINTGLLLMVLIAVHAVLQSQLTALRQREAALEEALLPWTAIEKQTLENKQQLASEQSLKMDFDHYQNATVDVFRHLIHAVKAPLCLISLRRKKSEIEIKGYAPSVNALMTFLKNWNTGDVIQEIKIEKLQQQDNGSLYFHLKANEINQPPIRKTHEDAFSSAL